MLPGRDLFLCNSDRLTYFRCIAQIESNYDEITDSFDSMQLKAELLRGWCGDLVSTLSSR